jgi:hypothetical protein
LSLLVLVVVGMLFWYKRMHGPVYQIGKGKSDIAVPWRQWHDIYVRTEKGHPPGEPTEHQAQIPKTLQIVAEPDEDGRQRGRLDLVILPDGSVRGHWGGQFIIRKDVDFQVMGCNFKGLVDPEQVYSDEQGEDPSKLFFIAKGPFVILETNDDNGKVRKLSGNIYVRGWLSVDNLIDGEIILTTDEKNFFLYTWKGKAEQGGLSLF